MHTIYVDSFTRTHLAENHFVSHLRMNLQSLNWRAAAAFFRGENKYFISRIENENKNFEPQQQRKMCIKKCTV